MSIPTHNLYDFVHQALENKFWLKYFYPWGSKDLLDVIDLFASDNVNKNNLLQYEYKDTCYSKLKLHNDIHENINWINFQPILFCHDQEPLQFDLYNDNVIDTILFDKWNNVGESFIENLNIRHTQPNSYQQYWILLHSELNSEELTRYENTNMFIGAYWWSHALIARDWYRYAEYDKNLLQKDIKHLFLVYCRDTEGSRQYRKDFLTLLKKDTLNDYCYFGNSNDSNDSAVYDRKDIISTGIHIILETIFDQRIHLTEKTLRPIACGQPFILANGPGSLKYLKSYGFQTFSPWIDESYDLETNNKKRLTKISNEMKRLANLPKQELDIIIEECNKIAEYNKNIFFSKNFLNQIINELQTNVNRASNPEKNGLSWKMLWRDHKLKKITDNDQKWKKRRPYMLHLIKHLKKGGTLEDYVPPDLD